MQFNRKSDLSFGIAFLVLLLIGVVSYRETQSLVESMKWVSHTHEMEKNLQLLRRHVGDVETSVQYYVPTGEQGRLTDYEQSAEAVGLDLQRLDTLTHDSAQRQNLSELTPLLQQQMELHHRVVELKSQGNSQAATGLLRSGQAHQRMEAIRSRLTGMQDRENELLRTRESEIERQALIATAVAVTGAFVVLAFLFAARWMLVQDARRLRAAETAARTASEHLNLSIQDLERHSREIETLNQMAEFLQRCATLEEACSLIGRYSGQLFSQAGALYLLAPSRDEMGAVITWNNFQPESPAFAPADCWALRGGREYVVRDGDLRPRCKHVGEAGLQGDYLCLPMNAHAEALGLFFLHCDAEASSSANPTAELYAPNVIRLARLVSEQAALALSNLKLRETLRMQSTQDPLTGLFNRRYLEETLERELRRTQRTQRPVSIILLDLDHFKNFNDSFGHPAGDLLLREVGELLKRGIRGGGDLAARYGGEEFVVVLPEAPLEQAENRANQLCKEIRALALSYHGQSLGAISASMGVACYPDTAADYDGLLSAADTALYRAKAEGRDRVVVAPRAGEQTPV